MSTTITTEGNLTADAELRFTKTTGQAVCTFRLAVSSRRKNIDGEYEDTVAGLLRGHLLGAAGRAPGRHRRARATGSSCTAPRMTRSGPTARAGPGSSTSSRSPRSARRLRYATANVTAPPRPTSSQSEVEPRPRPAPDPTSGGGAGASHSDAAGPSQPITAGDPPHDRHRHDDKTRPASTSYDALATGSCSPRRAPRLTDRPPVQAGDFAEFVTHAVGGCGRQPRRHRRTAGRAAGIVGSRTRPRHAARDRRLRRAIPPRAPHRTARGAGARRRHPQRAWAFGELYDEAHDRTRPAARTPSTPGTTSTATRRPPRRRRPGAAAATSSTSCASRLDAQRTREWAAYGEAFARQRPPRGRRAVPGLRVPVEVDRRAGLAERLRPARPTWTARRGGCGRPPADNTPLPGSGIPLQRLPARARPRPGRTRRRPHTRWPASTTVREARR